MVKPLSIVHGLNIVYDTIADWIEQEINDGILDDVKLFVKTEQDNVRIKTPYIWMEKERIYELEERKGELSRQMYLEIPVSFTCGYDMKNQEKAEWITHNIMGRLLATINIHKNKSRDNKICPIHRVVFKHIDPSGTVTIINKNKTTIGCRVTLKFIVNMNWMKCCSSEKIIELEKITKEEIKQYLN